MTGLLGRLADWFAWHLESARRFRQRLVGRPMAALMKRYPRLRTRLWQLTVRHNKSRHWRVLGRLSHWVWCHTAPLGLCQECRAPTWNPVVFQIRHSIGRSGHYYCERCGPPIRDAAVLLGEPVVQ